MEFFNVAFDGEHLIRERNGEIDIVEDFDVSEELRQSFAIIPRKIAYEDTDGIHIVRAPLLHCHTDNSQLDGAVKVADLAKKATDFVAITDHGVTTGNLEFFQECYSNSKKPIYGVEVYTENVVDGEKKANHLVLLVKNTIGYKNICKLLSEAENNFYRRPQVSLEMLEKYHEGLIALSACLGGEVARAIMEDVELAEEVVDTYLDIFGDDYYLEVQRHGLPQEEIVNNIIFSIAKSRNIKVVATPDSHYLNEQDALAQEVLLCIGTHKTMSDPTHFKFEGNNYHVPTAMEFEMLWQDKPEVFDGLFDVVSKIDFQFETGKLHMPKFPVPEGFDNDSYFVKLAKDGFKERFPSFESKEKEEEYRNRLDYEIKIILDMGFSGYFLIVQDYIAYARSIGGYVGPGRGSAVGSLAAYCLKITDLDPIPYGLLFERFLNPERVSMPDIDTDFDVEVRDKVVQYCRDKYGADAVSKIITFGTLSAKMVLRDVARVLDVDLVKADRFSKAVPAEPKMTLAKASSGGEFKRMLDSDPELQRVFAIAVKLEGLKRHRSTHACGVVIASDAINNFLPEILIQDKDTKTKVRTSSFTGPELEELGLLKMDVCPVR